MTWRPRDASAGRGLPLPAGPAYRAGMTAPGETLRTQVSVSVDDDHLASIGAVVQALEAQGLQVDQVLDGLGIVSGSVDDARRTRLSSVPGVASVDGSLSYQLPPPDAAVS